MDSGFSSFAQARFDEFVRRLDARMGHLPKQEAKLAQFMLLNLGSLGLETGRSLAEKVGVSEVTVGRLLRRLGCDGMKGLKQLLRDHYSVAQASFVQGAEIPRSLETTLEAEIKALTAVFRQTQNREWADMVALIAAAETVYTTGFQSVRGVVEDFTRRLALARRRVHFMAAHDGMLAEWLKDPAEDPAATCLILVDVIPYSNESQKLARLAKSQGRRIVMITDEYCHWSREIADAALYAPSRTGLFLESTLGIVLALSLITDATARANPDLSKSRLAQWKADSSRLGLF